LTTAKVQLPDGTFICFGSTHLDVLCGPANQQWQVDETGRLATGGKLPWVIAQEINVTPGPAVIATLEQPFRRSCQVCGTTIPMTNPNTTFGHIAFAPAGKFSVVIHKIIQERPASDYLTIMAVLGLKL
jgi:hypothetical protein